VLRSLLGCAGGGDGERVEVEGDRCVGGRVGRVRGQGEALRWEQRCRLAWRSCRGEDNRRDVGELALVPWVSAR